MPGIIADLIRIKILAVIEAAVEHALKGINTEYAMYIAMSVKKKKAMRPPDDKAEEIGEVENEKADDKKIRVECNHREALRVKRENKVRQREFNVGCMRALQGRKKLATPTTTTGMAEDNGYDDMDNEEFDYLKKLLASLNIYRKVCRGGSSAPPALKGIQAMSKALNYRQGEEQTPVQMVQEVQELMKVAGEHAVRLVVESVDNELLDKEKLR